MRYYDFFQSSNLCRVIFLLFAVISLALVIKVYLNLKQFLYEFHPYFLFLKGFVTKTHLKNTTRSSLFPSVSNTNLSSNAVDWTTTTSNCVRTTPRYMVNILHVWAETGSARSSYTTTATTTILNPWQLSRGYQNMRLKRFVWQKRERGSKLYILTYWDIPQAGIQANSFCLSLSLLACQTKRGFHANNRKSRCETKRTPRNTTTIV